MEPMSRTVLPRLAFVVLASAVPVAVSASPAWAPKYILGATAFGTCDLRDGASFQGSFTVSGFSSSGGQLYATGAVAGSCDSGGDVVATVPSTVTTFAVASVTATCSAVGANVEIRPGAGTVKGLLGDTPKDAEPVVFGLDLAPSTVVERSWVPGDPRATYGRLCAVTANVAHRDAASLATVLNALVLG
jgi:hypothetical protein